jgi:hypothetical protein
VIVRVYAQQFDSPLRLIAVVTEPLNLSNAVCIREHPKWTDLLIVVPIVGSRWT